MGCPYFKRDFGISFLNGGINMDAMTIVLVATAGSGFFAVGYVFGLISGVEKCQKVYNKFLGW